MITLDELRPSDKERELVKDMPDQVAVGYLRAKRKDDQDKTPQMESGIDFSKLFGQ